MTSTHPAPGRVRARRRAPTRASILCGLASLFVLACPRPAAADWELALLVGSAFPTYDERLQVRVSGIGTARGITVTPSGDFVFEADGGLAFGAALAWEVGGFFAIEGRLDTAGVELVTPGVEYQVAVNVPPLPPLSGSLQAGPGEVPLERLIIWSANLRLRTPGPVSIYGSGGISFLPRLRSSRGLPLQVSVNGLPGATYLRGELNLEAEPGESESRVGVNGGAGLRVRIGGPVSLFVDARVFAFKEHELRFDLDSDAGFLVLNDLVDALPPVRFDPLLYNVNGGIVFTF
jgi:hypothetical protein